MVRAACVGGADVVQLRDKTLLGGEALQVAKTLAAICREYGVLFIVNDRVDLALAAEADGVHLGQEDLPVAAARILAQRYGRTDFLIGKSTHSLTQALAAQKEAPDYIGVGPVFATPTKP